MEMFKFFKKVGHYLVYKKYILYHYIFIYKENIKLKEFNSNLRIEEVTLDNLYDALIYEPKEKVDKFYEFLNEGNIGYYAYYKELFAHRSWASIGPQKVMRWFDRASLYLTKGEAYFYWGETVPEFRGLGITPLVLKAMITDLNTNYNITQFHVTTTKENEPSQKGLEKAGFVLDSVMSIKSFLGFTLEKSINREKWDDV